MNFCGSVWGGVLWWWWKALPKRHPGLAPLSSTLETTASTATFGCQKKTSQMLKHFWSCTCFILEKDSISTNKKYQNTWTVILEWKLIILVLERKSSYLHLLTQKKPQESDSNRYWRNTEWLFCCLAFDRVSAGKDRKIQLKPEIPVNNCERCNGSISTPGAVEMHPIYWQLLNLDIIRTSPLPMHFLLQKSHLYLHIKK